MELEFHLLTKRLLFGELTEEQFIEECHKININIIKQCYKPESLYYRGYCEEKKNDTYCEGCDFWRVIFEEIKEKKE